MLKTGGKWPNLYFGGKTGIIYGYHENAMLKEIEFHSIDTVQAAFVGDPFAFLSQCYHFLRQVVDKIREVYRFSCSSTIRNLRETQMFVQKCLATEGEEAIHLASTQERKRQIDEETSGEFYHFGQTPRIGRNDVIIVISDTVSIHSRRVLCSTHVPMAIVIGFAVIRLPVRETYRRSFPFSFSARPTRIRLVIPSGFLIDRRT